MNENTIKEYAKLIVRTGANVQKGQDVWITADVADSYFVNYVAKEAYEAGANRVRVEWTTQALTRLAYEYQSVDALGEIPAWQEEKMRYQTELLPAMIYIDSDDPDGLNSIDPDKRMEVMRRTGPTRLKYREMMENKYQWTIVGIPGKAWAKKVFPALPEDEAMEALWDAILEVTRAKGDAVENWRLHNDNLKQKTTWLNGLGIRTLRYKSANGTDFTIDIDERLQFLAGGEYTLGGVYYQPNMPTEECFTSPVKTSANGTVMATKPLSVRGTLVENFGFVFENGVAVSVICENEKHRKVLEKLIATDEGSARLGEVALVPYDSPINRTGLLFFNTLYDENACCHLALGRAFTECIKNYSGLTEEEIKAVDLNSSIIHVDFMIGSSDLSITGITASGEEVAVFENGTWAC